MSDKEIIIDNCNVCNCKYYAENNGVEYQGLYQYTDMCYKLPYDNCQNKPFCWYKIITKIKRIIQCLYLNNQSPIDESKIRY